MIFIKKHFIKDTNNLDQIESMIRENQYRFDLLKMYAERTHIYHNYIMKKRDALNLDTIRNSKNYTKEFKKAMDIANEFNEMYNKLSNFQDMIMRIQMEALEFYNNTKCVLIEEIENYGNQD